ncbi:MAG: prolyl oligopeptidase family serine peptidase [Gemmatimonadales bacterium]|nr:prolyl oligopeptidase family serine peptidase [Gemmatimonadales bacterium]NIN13478.1 prolyl oligopeptidase family serine peptidase [Gemmatimonadales bacterium]NIQ99630.1 prolyl oligopeptidase family serine peptidase [Gemmatimonadales bacterium]NIS64187.1 prolyl oligopeptidase family serine peptidase [Gemmatimonadales bacterium]
MKRIGTTLLSIFCLAAVSLLQDARAQARGRELYDLMGQGRLTTTTGSGQARWLPGGRGLLTSRAVADSGTRFYRVDVVTGQESPLFDGATEDAIRRQYTGVTGEEPTGLPFDRFTFVNDGRAMTFTVDDKHFLWDFGTSRLRQLLRPEIEPQPYSQDLMRGMSRSQLWNGTYSPDYTHFAYVKGYDLYITNTVTGEEKRLTSDGNEDTFNGRPNWVYPEEFNQRDAYWWSPDGRKLAYYRSDESDVHKFPIVHHLSPEAELELQSYPKAGEPNPTVVLKIIDIETGETVEIQTNSTPDNYIVRPIWLPDGSEILLRRLNRHQSVLELLAADVRTGRVRTILTERELAFVNLQDDFRLLEDGERFLWSSERTGWRHLYLYSLRGDDIAQLTSGEWPVGSIVRLDEDEEWVYFTGNTEMGLETHFFRVRLDGSSMQKLTTDPGTHRISMDPTGRYYVDSYSSFTTPNTANLHNADGSLIRNLMTTNTARLDSLALEPPELVIVKAADGVTELHGMLFKPAGYDPNVAYPLVVPVYGGPHSKAISNRYYHSSGDQRLAQLGFMVWRVDNRGQRNRGKAFETETYLKLGQVDLADQTAAVRQITQRPYIDGSRVGIYGGSYGGYMTVMALLKEPEVFHVGVASSSVTDWRNYDTIYTERYMRTPQENEEGYDLGSALPYAENLEGKLLLMHGTIDNNVHPGNTIQLVDALVKAGRNFDLMFYPDNRHGIRGAAGRHASKMRIDYLVEHLDPPAYPWEK